MGRYRAKCVSKEARIKSMLSSPMTRRQLSQELKMDYGDVTSVCKRLIERGEVEVVGKGGKWGQAEKIRKVVKR